MFCSPLIDDVANASRLRVYLSIFTEEVHQQLLNSVLQWAPNRSHGLHSCFLASCRCDYWYGRGCAANNPLPDYLRILCMIMSEIFYHSGKQYNALHVNLFLEKSKLTTHADNERMLGPQPNILSFSLGSTRTFRVTDTSGGFTDIPLPHGTFAQMSGDLQRFHTHEILRDETYEGPRINFTFREIVQHGCDSQDAVVRDITHNSVPDLNPHQIKWYSS